MTVDVTAKSKNDRLPKPQCLGMLLQNSFLRLKKLINPFAPRDFAEKRVLKLVEWFSSHCRAIKS